MSRWQVQTLTETPRSLPVVATITENVTEITNVVNFQYQALAQCPKLPVSEVVTMDKWYHQFNNPRLPLPRFTIYEQKHVRTISFPETVTADRWYAQPEIPKFRAATYQSGFQTLFIAHVPPPPGTSVYFIDERGQIYKQVSSGTKFPLIYRIN